MTEITLPNSLTEISTNDRSSYLDNGAFESSGLTKIIYKGQEYTGKTALEQAFTDNNVSYGTRMLMGTEIYWN